jgi:opacity protein-like surface antigen
MLKKLIMGAALATLLASPALAQSYVPEYGTGNIINLPAAEATNGAVGIGANAWGPASGATSAYAYVPRTPRVDRHHMRHRYYSR